MFAVVKLFIVLAVLMCSSAARSQATAIDAALFPHARFLVQIDGLVEPADVECDEHGHIYIAEAGRHRVAVFDLNGEFVRSIGEHGVGAGQFVGPERVMLRGNELIVMDSRGRRWQVFARDGQFLREAEDPLEVERAAWLQVDELRKRHGSLPGQFRLPGGWAKHANQFLVADTHNHRVQLLDADGSSLAIYARTSHTPHEGRGKVRAPNAVAISPDGRYMAVCEAIEQRCQVFALDDISPADDAGNELLIDVPQLYGPRMGVGANAIALYFPGDQKVMVIDAAPPHHLITEFGDYGSRLGQFERIGDLTIEPSMRPNEFFVEIACDALRRVSVAKIDRTRTDNLGLATVTFMKSVDVEPLPDGFVGSDARTIEGITPLILTPAGEIRFLDRPAIQPGGQDATYLCDCEHALVRLIGAHGESVTTFGSRGSENGQLAKPSDVALMPDGRVAVLDVGHQRIIFFDQAGKYLSHFGTGRIAPLPAPAWRE